MICYKQKQYKVQSQLEAALKSLSSTKPKEFNCLSKIQQLYL